MYSFSVNRRSSGVRKNRCFRQYVGFVLHVYLCVNIPEKVARACGRFSEQCEPELATSSCAAAYLKREVNCDQSRLDTDFDPCVEAG
jgi:hypothetical protein